LISLELLNFVYRNSFDKNFLLKVMNYRKIVSNEIVIETANIRELQVDNTGFWDT
jgi:hypothetical protein